MDSEKSRTPVAPHVDEKDIGGSTSDSERSNVGDIETHSASIGGSGSQDLLGHQDEDPAMSKKMHLINNVCLSSTCLSLRGSLGNPADVC